MLSTIELLLLSLVLLFIVTIVRDELIPTYKKITYILLLVSVILVLCLLNNKIIVAR